MKKIMIGILIFVFVYGEEMLCRELPKVLKLDFRIKEKKTYILKNKAKITTKTNRKIIIESGGTLKIQKGAACTLDVKIEIQPGGKMEFEENTLAWIDEKIFSISIVTFYIII